MLNLVKSIGMLGHLLLLEEGVKSPKPSTNYLISDEFLKGAKMTVTIILEFSYNPGRACKSIELQL